jgi:hypothetical protein
MWIRAFNFTTKKKLLSLEEGDDCERVTEIVFGPKMSIFKEVCKGL